MGKKPHSRDLQNLQAQHEHQEVVSLGDNILAIDYGTRYTGIAFAQKSGAMIPIGVLKTDENLQSSIKKIIEERSIKRLIFGLPLGQDGSTNPLCKVIKKIAAQLRADNLSIDFINEKFSSQMTISSDSDRIDDLAALQILEFYLAKHS